MSEDLGRLSLALADRYRIERELGQGGMATVSAVQVSDQGGTEPNWARSGWALYYRTAGDLVSVAVTAGANFSIGARRTVLQQVRPSNAAIAGGKSSGRPGRVCVGLAWPHRGQLPDILKRPRRRLPCLPSRTRTGRPSE